MSKKYVLSFNSEEASSLRSAAHIAANLLAVTEYDKLRGVRDLATRLHCVLVGLGARLHPDVLDFESKCHAAFGQSAAFKEPKPEPVRWEVQAREEGSSNKWFRSAASFDMKNPTRAEAYRMLRKYRSATGDRLVERRVAKVGDYDHVPGTYHVEYRRPGGSWKSMSDLVPPAPSWRAAKSNIEAWKAYAMNGSEFRTVFVADK